MALTRKVLETRKYTEYVFYDQDGNELGRERQDDDWLYDDKEVEITEDDMEDYS